MLRGVSLKRYAIQGLQTHHTGGGTEGTLVLSRLGVRWGGMAYYGRSLAAPLSATCFYGDRAQLCRTPAILTMISRMPPWRARCLCSVGSRDGKVFVAQWISDISEGKFLLRKPTLLTPSRHVTIRVSSDEWNLLALFVDGAHTHTHTHTQPKKYFLVEFSLVGEGRDVQFSALDRLDCWRDPEIFSLPCDEMNVKATIISAGSICHGVTKSVCSVCFQAVVCCQAILEKHFIDLFYWAIKKHPTPFKGAEGLCSLCYWKLKINLIHNNSGTLKTFGGQYCYAFKESTFFFSSWPNITS